MLQASLLRAETKRRKREKRKEREEGGGPNFPKTASERECLKRGKKRVFVTPPLLFPSFPFDFPAPPSAGAGGQQSRDLGGKVKMKRRKKKEGLRFLLRENRFVGIIVVAHTRGNFGNAKTK